MCISVNLVTHIRGMLTLLPHPTHPHRAGLTQADLQVFRYFLAPKETLKRC